MSNVELPPLPVIPEGSGRIDRIEIWSLMRSYATEAVLRDRERRAVMVHLETPEVTKS